MTQTVYTNYWQNRIGNIRKEHGSYKSEEEAIAVIKAWWEPHKENHKNVQNNRTNSGALEIVYDDKNYVYRNRETHNRRRLAQTNVPTEKSRRSGITAREVQSQQRIVPFR